MNACRTNAKLQPHKGDKLPQRVPLDRASVCEKRKPEYTSRVPKSTLSLSHYARRKHLLWLRPRSYLLLCNVKIKELVPP